MHSVTVQNLCGFFSPADYADFRRGFSEPQIAPMTQIFSQLQIERITQKLLMRKRMNYTDWLTRSVIPAVLLAKAGTGIS